MGQPFVCKSKGQQRGYGWDRVRTGHVLVFLMGLACLLGAWVLQEDGLAQAQRDAWGVEWERIRVVFVVMVSMATACVGVMMVWMDYNDWYRTTWQAHHLDEGVMSDATAYVLARVLKKDRAFGAGHLTVQWEPIQEGLAFQAVILEDGTKWYDVDLGVRCVIPWTHAAPGFAAAKMDFKNDFLGWVNIETPVPDASAHSRLVLHKQAAGVDSFVVDRSPAL